MSALERMRLLSERTGNGCVKFIEPVKFLYSLYLFGSMPLESQSVRFLVIRNSGEWTQDSPWRNNSAPGSNPGAEVEAETARWLMYMNIAALIPALFSTVFLGALSNRVGRKFVLLLPLIGGAFRMLIFLFVFTFNLSLVYLVLSSFVDGLFGMSCTMLMACFTYASDITTYQQRSIRIVLLQLVAGLASIVSSLATGFLIQAVGYVWMFVILLGILAATFCYVVLVLQESLVYSVSNIPKSSAQPFAGAYVHFFGLKGTARDRRCDLLTVLLVSFLVGFVQLGQGEVQTLFLFTSPFFFNSVWIGYFNAASSLIVNVAMTLATWTLGRFVGDVGLTFLGAAFGVSYELVFGYAVNTLMVFLAPLAGCGMIMPIALLRAHVSKIVDPSDVALAFACFAWLETISAFVGSIVQNAIFASTATWKSNFVFLFDAAVYGTACLIIVFLKYLHCAKKRAQNQPILKCDEKNDVSFAVDQEDVALLNGQR